MRNGPLHGVAGRVIERISVSTWPRDRLSLCGEETMPALFLALLLQAHRPVSPLDGADKDLQNGNFRDGLRKLSALMVRKPDDPHVHSTFVYGLLDAGLGDAARDEARRWV